MLHSDQSAPLRVFWRPGCSSCARVKEFLATRGIDFEPVDISADPTGAQTLAERGIRSVPVIMRGEAYSYAQSLDDVADFLAIHHPAAPRLTPSHLVERWGEILATARALFGQATAELARYEPVPNRSLLDIAYHIVRIPVSFLACVEQEVREWVPISMASPPDGLDMRELDDLAAAAEVEIGRWWAGVDDPTCQWPVDKYDGVHSAHVFLERQVWHTAHHTRQLATAFRDQGVDIGDALRPELFDGLPMPSRVW